MTAPLKVGVWGATGYAGAELLRLGLAHPGIDFVHLASASHAGQRISQVFPALAGILDTVLDPLDPALAAGCDVLFSCLPHGESHARLAPLVDRVALIDLSGDFRLDTSANHEAAYGHAHPHPELLERFVYGLPELHRDRLVGSRTIANPGCFATACALSLLPLAREGWLAGHVALSAVTGSSGSGAKPAAGTHHPNRSQDFHAYKPLAHQHEPEIAMALRQAGGRDFTLDLVTHSAPLVRGIHVTAFVALPSGIDDEQVQAAYRRHYDPEPFVRLTSEAHVARVRGLNMVDIALKVRGRTLVVMAAIDNLVRGASGQAVHNFNLAHGFPETTGLSLAPMVV